MRCWPRHRRKHRMRKLKKVAFSHFFDTLTPCAAWCSSLVSGYLFSRPRLPQCGKVVQRRRRSSNSLPYWISCSLHRPPDALTVDPITSPWLFDLARKIHTHQRPKKNTMQRMVFFFGIRRLPIFPGRHQPSIFGV